MRTYFVIAGLLAAVAISTPAHAVQELIQSGTATPIPFLLVDSATGQLGQTGQASNCTVTVCKPGTTSYTASGGTVTELGNGLYQYTPTTSETGSGSTCGFLIIHVTDTTGSTQTVDVSAQIVAFNPNSAANLGLTSLPTANPAASGGLPTIGTATGQINPAGGTFTGVGLAATQSGVTIPTVTNVTNAVTVTGSAPNGFLAADATVNGLNTAVGTISTNTNPSAIAGDVQTGLTSQGYTTTLASNIGTTNSSVSTNLNATVGSRSTYSGSDTPGTATLLSRIGQALTFDTHNIVETDPMYWNNVAVTGMPLAASAYTPPPTLPTEYLSGTEQTELANSSTTGTSNAAGISAIGTSVSTLLTRIPSVIQFDGSTYVKVDDYAWGGNSIPTYPTNFSSLRIDSYGRVATLGAK